MYPFDDTQPLTLPAGYEQIQAESLEMGFSMPSDLLTCSLLRTLAATKSAARVLEIGTGTGLATAWLLDGNDPRLKVTSVDNEAQYQAVAERVLGEDSRLELICTDGREWLKTYDGEPFDLIFADAWPGKYDTLTETLSMLKTGGMYVIDDMLPQPNWPAGHELNVVRLVEELEANNALTLTKLNWSTGIVIAVKNEAKDRFGTSNGLNK
jgi:predicted O-methyltransferase YrrM